ncbi:MULTISPECIES: RagB/SusD family nutrient uptake outer membrane protein [Prevotellaceae]|uniref:RagB/SusD family nutrient uptake outer membrane protein n=1 Tax=Prevotellaceae TaxID=171552 RepID=UPI0018A86A93|nr:RagB/SusD family nutrient uptake outer membrane protein [Prevotella phocaeensis]
MKKYHFLKIIMSSMFLCSCTDYLETPPSVDLDENKVFADRSLTERYLTGVYAEGMPLGFCMSSSNTDRRLCSSSTLGSACDEAEDVADWAKGNSSWNVDNHNNNSAEWDEDCRHYLRWETLRKCNIILERINEVPYDVGDPDFNRRTAGEAYFMRAMLLWEGVYRYGGLPIIHFRLSPNDFSTYPRNTFSDCVDSVLVDCDRAASLLPDYYTDATKVGRATRIAALALKSRVLLYAASPLFNTDTPYLPFNGHENLICYGNYDKERWKKAADAAKEALDAAIGSGHYGLYADGTPETNYEHVWTVPDNKEIILANKKYRNFKVSSRPMVADLPVWAMNKAWGDGGLYVTFNFVKFYEKRDGTQADWSDTGGDNLMDIYKTLDPRFSQTVAYHGASWNNEIPFIDFLPNGAQSSATDKTRHLVRKWVPRTMKVTPPLNTTNVDWIVFRVAELYLNYAEALNEYYDVPPQEAFDTVEKVRERSGMPGFPTSLTKEEFREKLRNERGVELAFEDHRFWDIRRWLIAEQEGVMRGKMYGLKISSVDGSKSKIHYEPYVFESRSWSRRSYLHGIMQNEVDKGYLIQNPGW